MSVCDDGKGVAWKSFKCILVEYISKCFCSSWYDHSVVGLILLAPTPASFALIGTFSSNIKHYCHINKLWLESPMATLHSPIFVFHKSRVHILQPVTYTWCVENHQRLGHNLNPTKYRNSHSVNISFAFTITFYHVNSDTYCYFISFTPWQILTFIGNAIPSGKLYFIFICSPFTVSWGCYNVIPSKELLWPGQETPLVLSAAASWPVPS